MPRIHLKLVLDALHKAGAGQVGKYNECSFTVDGVGTFKPGHEANPVIGQRGKTEEVQEARLEVIYATHLEKKILAALREAHPYEEIAYYATRLANVNQDLGAGLVGRLAQPEDALSFLSRVKSALKTAVVRHTRVLKPTVQRIAICGGAGAFLIQDAIRAGADVFVTADLKYHDFFEHNDRLILADPGHYESEQFTIDLLVEVLSKKFVTFAVNFSNTSTNPISYL
ncbi:MAG: Nif3-like dinuclear metal center hexameric protein [Cyclobacteriaceae bacterium]|nr:Nif3-like dinuclear metal center hexameric protein [Cyclobacteriaceae bacterium]